MKRVASPGRLKHRVIIERPAACEDPNTVTDQPQCWETVVECWASVRPVSVKEIYAAGGYLGQHDVAVIVRYDPLLDDLDTDWRIWFQNRKLDVAGKMNMDSRDTWLKILTSRKTDDIRLRDENFDDSLNHAVNVVMPGLADG